MDADPSPPASPLKAMEDPPMQTTPVCDLPSPTTPGPPPLTIPTSPPTSPLEEDVRAPVDDLPSPTIPPACAPSTTAGPSLASPLKAMNDLPMQTTPPASPMNTDLPNLTASALEETVCATMDAPKATTLGPASPLEGTVCAPMDSDQPIPGSEVASPIVETACEEDIDADLLRVPSPVFLEEVPLPAIPVEQFVVGRELRGYVIEAIIRPLQLGRGSFRVSKLGKTYFCRVLGSTVPNRQHALHLAEAATDVAGVVPLIEKWDEGDLAITIHPFYPDAEPLRTYANKIGASALDRAFSLFYSILSAVATLHRTGHHHGALHVDNFLVTNGTVLLHAYHDKGTAQPWYGAPEGGSKRPSDIWGLGCLLAYLLTHNHPFASKDSKPHTVISHLESVLPPKVGKLLAAMLELTPQERCTMKEVFASECLMEYCFQASPLNVTITPSGLSNFVKVEVTCYGSTTTANVDTSRKQHAVLSGRCLNASHEPGGMAACAVGGLLKGVSAFLAGMDAGCESESEEEESQLTRQRSQNVSRNIEAIQRLGIVDLRRSMSSSPPPKGIDFEGQAATSAHVSSRGRGGRVRGGRRSGAGRGVAESEGLVSPSPRPKAARRQRGVKRAAEGDEGQRRKRTQLIEATTDGEDTEADDVEKTGSPKKRRGGGTGRRSTRRKVVESEESGETKEIKEKREREKEEKERERREKKEKEKEEKEKERKEKKEKEKERREKEKEEREKERKERKEKEEEKENGMKRRRGSGARKSKDTPEQSESKLTTDEAKSTVTTTEPKKKHPSAEPKEPNDTKREGNTKETAKEAEGPREAVRDDTSQERLPHPPPSLSHDDCVILWLTAKARVDYGHANMQRMMKEKGLDFYRATDKQQYLKECLRVLVEHQVKKKVQLMHEEAPS